MEDNMEKTTQMKQVLIHLNTHGSISSKTAFEEYGITRLSAIIWVLRRAGHKINSHLESTKNRYGNHTHYSVYELKGCKDGI